MDLDVQVPADDVVLLADVSIPPEPVGVVVFAHGAGSSRRSPRNRYVARTLCEAGFVTVLADLLTEAEDADPGTGRTLRFDVDTLGRRVTDLAQWSRDVTHLSELPVSLFGASTGAAAALRAAAELPDVVRAVVSRGGRPDLAGDALEQVRAATLLLVGGDDERVLELNEEAYSRLGGTRELTVVPGAGHLFEEPGTLEEVASRAKEWLLAHAAEEVAR